MVRRSLMVATVLAIASPLAAQDEWTWTSGRPDGTAPIGVSGDRTLAQHEVLVTYRFAQFNSRGVWVVNDSLPLAETLGFYSVAPLTLSRQTHSLTVAAGVTPDLTLMGSAEVSIFEREHVTNGGIFYRTGAEDLGDIAVNALYSILNQGGTRAHLQMGAVLPIGATGSRADTPFGADQVHPYDMRSGGGTFALTPGATLQTQNERGSVGAQFVARINLGTGGRDYTLGDVYRADGWAAMQINGTFSVSGGLRYRSWGSVEGSDPELDPGQDPGNDGLFMAGQRLDLPLGLNIFMPEASVLAGHRVFAEATYTIHHDYEGPQLGLDWGLTLGYQVGF